MCTFSDVKVQEGFVSSIPFGDDLALHEQDVDKVIAIFGHLDCLLDRSYF